MDSTNDVYLAHQLFNLPAALDLAALEEAVAAEIWAAVAVDCSLADLLLKLK